MALLSPVVRRVARRTQRWLVHAGLGGLGASVALALASIHVDAPLVDVLSALGFASLAGAAALGAEGRRKLPGGLRVEGDRLTIVPGGHETQLPLADLESGLLVPSPRAEDPRCTVELRTRDGDLWQVEAPYEAAGQAFLAELGLAPEQRRVRIERHVGVGTLLALSTVAGGALALLLGQLGLGAAPPWPDPLTALACALLALGVGLESRDPFGPPPLDIGADGVAWREGRPVFLPYRAIRAARLERGDLVLETDERTRRIDLGSVRPGVQRAVQRLVSRLAGVGERPDADRFARRGRRFDEWVADLKTGSSYRAARVPRARVLETLEDASAPADQRLGAALALAADDEQGVVRARVAELARSCADPDLALALEELAEDRLRAETAERLGEAT
ncbi:MAG TPA: hypothetical protein RMG95_16515 [Polyangiaceae bacterium LLY-WYZ-15_(1-7)]|nr:hypothetical protein [Polyangiaceae bacterium LLY-WYZ-15_(1-7)]